MVDEHGREGLCWPAVREAGVLDRVEELLVGLRKGHHRPRRSARHVQVEVAVDPRRLPGLPARVGADGLSRADDERVPLVARREVVEAILVRIGQRSRPVGERLVPGRVHPDDAGVPGRLRDPVGQLGEHPGARPVAVAAVEEAAGHVDHVDAEVDRVVLGAAEVDDRVDADEMQLRRGRELVHDLRDGRAVPAAGGEAARAETAGRHVRRKIARGLPVRVAGEARVEDRDRRARAVEAGGVDAIRAEERDPLAVDGGRLEGRRPVDAADVRAGRERRQVVGRDERLDERAVGALDLAAGSLDRRRDGLGRARLDDHPDKAVRNVEPRRARDRERPGRRPRGRDTLKRGVELDATV